MRRMYSQNQLENEIKNVKKDISTLVDANGNPRFIEGDINLGESASLANITKGYGKWSLSGTHLMMVLFIQNQTESDITINAYTSITANIELPDFVKSKIATLGTATAIDFKKAEIVNPSSVLTVKASKTVYCAKASGGAIIIANGESIKLEPNDLTRISFDLLIDND